MAGRSLFVQRFAKEVIYKIVCFQMVVLKIAKRMNSLKKEVAGVGE
jgi:hypothetical protein